MTFDRNLAVVIAARVVGVAALVAAFVVPCFGFPMVVFPGPWWNHLNLIIVGLIATPFVCISLALVLLHFPRRVRPPADRVCRRCGYDLRAQNSEGNCPECGTAI